MAHTLRTPEKNDREGPYTPNKHWEWRKRGTVEVGKLADIVVIDANSQQNLQCLYGTNAVFLNEKKEVTRKGGEK